MIEQINNIAQTWWQWMWPMFWQVTLLVGLISLINLAIRKRVWPQIRYALWLLVLIKLVLPPSLALPTSVTSHLGPTVGRILWSGYSNVQANSSATTELGILPMLPHEDATVQFTPAITTESTGAPMEPAVAEPGMGLEVPTAVTHRPGPKLYWQAYVLFAWLAGVVLLAAWLGMRLRQLRKVHRGPGAGVAVPKRLEQLLADAAGKLRLRRLPEIVLSPSVASPAVFGVFRPVLLIPAEDIQQLSRADIEHIFLHELAHIKRGDLVVHAVNMVLQVVYWFNPLLWIVRKQLQHLRELCCDATVAWILREKISDYSQTILETARRLLAKPVGPGMGLLGLFEDANRLAVRLKWLEKKSWKHRTLRIITSLVVISLMCACVLPMAKAQPEVIDAKRAQPLFDAIETGDAKKVEKMLTANPALANTVSKHGYTPLQAVARSGKPVKKFLGIKRVGKATDEFHSNMLRIAELLLDHGADIQARDRYDDQTVLHMAVFAAVYDHNRPGLVEFFVKNGADVNSKNSVGLTPLHLVARSTGGTHMATRLAVAKVLLANGANPLAEERHMGQWPMESAFEWRSAGGKPIFDLLQEHTLPLVGAEKALIDDAALRLMKAIVADDSTVMTELTVDVPAETGWEYILKELRKEYNNPGSHQQILATYFRSGFAKVYLAKEPNAKESTVRLWLMKFPDGSWRALAIGKSVWQPPPPGTFVSVSLQDIYGRYRNAVFDAAGRTGDLTVTTNVTSGIPKDGQELVVSVRNGHLRLSMPRTGPRWLFVVESSKGIVKYWTHRGSLCVAKIGKWSRDDIVLEVKDGQAIVSQGDKQMTFDAHNGKVRITSNNGETFQAYKIIISLESLDISLGTSSAEGRPTHIPDVFVQKAQAINSAPISTDKAQPAMQPEDEHPVLDAARSFLEALKQGRVEKKVGFPLVPGASTTMGWTKLREHFDLSEIQIAEAHVSDTDACVVSSFAQSKDAQRRGAIGVRLYTYERQWFVRNTNVLPDENAAREFVERFYKTNPNAIEIEIQPATQPAPTKTDAIVAAESLFDFGDGIVYFERLRDMLLQAKIHMGRVTLAYQKEDWDGVDAAAKEVRDIFRTLDNAIKVDSTEATEIIGRMQAGVETSKSEVEKANLWKLKQPLTGRAANQNEYLRLTQLIVDIADVSDELHDAIRDKKMYVVAGYYDRLAQQWRRFAKLKSIAEVLKSKQEPATQAEKSVAAKVHYTFDTDEGLDIISSEESMNVGVQDGELRISGKTTDTEWGSEGTYVPVNDLGGSLDASIDFKLPKRENYGLVYLALYPDGDTGPPMILYQWHSRKRIWLIRPASSKGWYQVHTMWLKTKWWLENGRRTYPDVGNEDTEFVTMRMYLRRNRKQIDYYINNVLVDTLNLAEPLGRVNRVLVAFQSPKLGYEYDIRFDNLKISSTPPDKSHIPPTSTIDARGRIIDKLDYPFVDDPAVIGTWKSVDFVAEIKDFDPRSRQFKSDLYLKELVFLANGRTTKPWWSWTKGLLFHTGGDQTASKYLIREIDGSSYMFIQWKSGDYTIRHQKPMYYVLKKALIIETAIFGPVIKRTIYDLNHRKDCYLDFERGNLSSHTKAFRPHEELALWRSTGADCYVLLASPDPNDKEKVPFMSIHGLETAMIRVEEELWNGTPSAVAEQALLAGPDTADFINAGDLGDLVLLMRPKGRVPVTFAFKTRKGGMGILQIVGFTENPKGVKIRYKMVESGRPAAPADSSSLLRPSEKPLNPGNFVYITGDVSRPGAYKWNPELDMTVLRMLAGAGFDSRKAGNYRVMISHLTDSSFESKLLNIKAISEGKEQEVELQPGYILTVTELAAQPATQPSKKLTFGPVIERVIPSAPTEGKEWLIDFDTGKIISISPDEFAKQVPKIEGVNAYLAWYRQTGMDAVVRVEEPFHGLVGIQLVVVPAKDADGLNLKADALVNSVSGLKPGTGGSLRGGTPLVYKFKTREGGMGILQIVGFTENPKGVKIRYKMVQSVKSATQPSENLTFGPVIERVVNDLDEESNMYIDFDTGKLLTLPSDLEPTDQDGLHRWIVNTGADAVADRNRPPLRSLDMTVATADTSDGHHWATITPDSVLDLLNRIGQEFVRWAPAPNMHVFKTREGGMGVLQIVGFTENPKGVKIRYKMVQSVKSAP